MNANDLTRPEMFVERAQSRERRKVVKAKKGCSCCVFRAGSAFGMGYCRIASMTFPRCVDAGGSVTYTPDYGAIRRLEAA